MRKTIGMVAAVGAVALVASGCFGISKGPEPTPQVTGLAASTEVVGKKAEADRTNAAPKIESESGSKAADNSPSVNRQEPTVDKTTPPAQGDNSTSQQEKPASDENKQIVQADSSAASNVSNSVAVPNDTSGNATGAAESNDSAALEANAARTTAKVLEELRASYTGQLGQLKSTVIDKTQALAASAIESRKNGESSASIMGKYSQKAIGLQEEADAKVNQLLAALREELKSRQLPVELVNELRTQYNSEVQQAKSQIEEKMKAAFTQS